MTPGRLWKQWTLWTAAVVGTIALIISFPFILRIAAPSGMDWSQLSEVSEAYGALAVLFSAAAFLGAIVSILYQAKQTRAMNEEIRSSIHKELTLHSIEDETLMHCWQPPSEPCTLAQARQHMFCSLIYRLWLADYVVGRTTLEATRIVLKNHFKGEVARRHWRIMGRQGSVGQRLTQTDETGNLLHSLSKSTKRRLRLGRRLKKIPTFCQLNRDDYTLF